MERSFAGKSSSSRTTSVLGFLRVWALGRLRFLRPASLRYQRESMLMDRWERAVLDCAALDTELACEVAEMATVVKGYGEVRRRLMSALASLVDEILAPAVARDRGAGGGYARATLMAREARQLILEDGKDIEAAVARLTSHP
jgi:indolepyruvate ferredoxin oxidoreductase beta subunit